MDINFITFMSLIVGFLGIFTFMKKRDKDIEVKGAEIALLKQQVLDIKNEMSRNETRLESKIDAIGGKIDDLQKQIIDLLKSNI
tara:strand:- start:1626 stop:1877 length:252 start_codon:yes stop_codon:yes gene_type:complete